MTRKEKSKIICKEINKTFDLDQTYLVSCVWDALKEIEEKETHEKEMQESEVRSIKTLRDRKEFVSDFLFLLNGDFTFIAKRDGSFYIYDKYRDGFTLKILEDNKIFIDNYYIFLNDSDCLKTFKESTLSQNSFRNVKAFEEKWGLNEKELDKDMENEPER